MPPNSVIASPSDRIQDSYGLLHLFARLPLARISGVEFIHAHFSTLYTQARPISDIRLGTIFMAGHCPTHNGTSDAMMFSEHPVNLDVAI